MRQDRHDRPGPIDCDIHPIVPGIAALLPYLDDHWRETVVRRGIEDLTTIAYPTRNPLSFRQEWRDDTGRTGTDVATLGRQALDPFGTRLAICNCLYGVQAQFSEDLGAAFARALNDWMVKEWLDRDARLRASIVVPMQNAEMAVDEIERCAPDRRFVQVMLLVGSENTLGRRQYWPIYAAAERLGLPVGIHAGFDVSPPDDAGWLADDVHRGIRQPGDRLPISAHQPDRRGRFRQVSGADRGADGIRRDLAAGLSLAPDEILEGAAQRNSVGVRSPGLHRPRPGAIDAAAVRCAARSGVGDAADRAYRVG